MTANQDYRDSSRLCLEVFWMADIKYRTRFDGPRLDRELAKNMKSSSDRFDAVGG